MLRIDLAKRAEKFVDSRNPKQQRQIAQKVMALRQDPEPTDSKALSGKLKGLRRADVGEYRIIYRVEGETLLVPVIGNRNDGDVYRRAERALGR